MPELKIEDQLPAKYKLTQPRIIPFMHDLKNGRWYEDDNKFKISVTTFLNKMIAKDPYYEKWLGDSHSYKDAMEYSGSRANLGSELHTDFYNFSMFNELKITGYSEERIKRLYEFQQFWLQKRPKPFASECKLWHPDLPFAGTLDLLCHITLKDGITYFCLLDYKTGGIWRTYPLQLSCYKYLAELVFGIPIDKLFLVQFRGAHRASCGINDDPRYGFFEIKPIPLKLILALYELLEIDHPNLKPEFPTKYPDKLILIQKTKEEINEQRKNVSSN